ncbi:NAD(P)-binding protein [Massarina eburnea CBS 473.64]|uniref:NAD(P)-binding protein n=1 Tax=Massarina eburnea CBS 473.64 TaxID=1395130 RepID=A0A6A6S7P3_9PLEO|nr:NAD(P)-binding protein [Massarina eburnea CBS 473.64]
MSPVIAVAGGSGGLGRAIVDALKTSAKYDVVILSRKTNPKIESETGARVLATDYANVESVVQVLEENKVYAVIATLTAAIDPAQELNLIEACERSGVTKRYMPSIWSAIPFTIDKELAKDTGISVLSAKFNHTISVLEKTSLEHTAVFPGLFLDYFVQGLPSYIEMAGIFVDVKNNVAAIPGSGNVPVSFTYTSDVGKYVVALLGKAEGTWKPAYLIAADNRTWNEVVSLAEKAKGVKFNVAFDSVEKLKEGIITELPGHADMYEMFGGGESGKKAAWAILSTYGVWMEEGRFHYTDGPFLNEEFGDIVPLKMEEAWKKVVGTI